MKYGRVQTELKELPHDEPVFIIRGQDVLAPLAIEGYANLLRAVAFGGEPLDDYHAKMADEVSNVAAQIIAWQAMNPHRVKLPDL